MISFLENDKEIISKSIEKMLISESSAQDKIVEFMNYSLSGGKMLRGIFVLEFSKMFGFETEEAVPFAVALECIQAYSLIHDDLPCMDNDDTRRGKPSSHIKFGEANAILAGDALLTYAFSAISESKFALKYSDRAIKAVELLAKFAGYRGMVCGQVLDIELSENENSNYDISLIHSLKTIALMKAAAEIGCVISGADEKCISIADKYIEDFGAAFQILDDLSDYKSGKKENSSYVNIYGESKAIADIYSHIANAGSALYEFNTLGYDTGSFAMLLDFLLTKVE